MVKQSKISYKPVMEEEKEKIPVHGKYSRPIVDETLKTVNDLRAHGIVANAYVTDDDIGKTKHKKIVPLYSHTGELVFSFLLLGIGALIGWLVYGDVETVIKELPVLPILGFWCVVSKRRLIFC